MTKNRKLLRAFSLILTLALLLSFGTVTAFALTPEEEAEAIKRMEEWANNLQFSPGPNGSSGSGSSGGSNTTPKSNPTADDFVAYAQKVFELVNKEREKDGLQAVVWDGDFAACARIRAEELLIKYSHERPGSPEDYSGDWPANMNGSGIYNAPTVADEQGIDHSWIMENIARGHTTPENVTEAWMKSDDHRNNILRDDHTRCGVGVYYSGEKTLSGNNWYWVVWFDNY